MQYRVDRPDDMTDMPPSLLVSAVYDPASKAVVLKFYDPKEQRIILWKDNTGHRPYCYSMLAPDEVRRETGTLGSVKVTAERLYDTVGDRSVDVSKITAGDPMTIAAVSDRMETLESDIKYYESYLYDRRLIVGKTYAVRNSVLVPHDEELTGSVQADLKSLLWDRGANEGVVDEEQFQRFTEEWAHLLNQPIPDIRRVAVDIEVDAQEGRVPDPMTADRRVTAVGFAGTGGFRKVLMLDTGAPAGDAELSGDVEVKFYKDEAALIRDALDIIAGFPFVLTYNGDEFDLPYLHNRARNLRIPGENPLYMMKNTATLRRGVHLDLYRTMSNRAFQIYVFSQKYTSFSLDSVSLALLGEGKVDYGKPLGELTMHENANYCYNDARLTLKLTTFDDGLLMNLLVIIARIGRMPVDDISRLGISQWIRSLLFYEHRKIGARIPGRQELENRTAGVTSNAVIKDKKYRGGLVIEPVKGVHFGVTVVDFASLYPSIIKVRNISYETVRCAHEECRKNTIPQTNHWVCGKRNGMTSMIIGSLRDLRVNYYKALSRSGAPGERRRYGVIAQALKVILNASYGVMGADIFPLYFLPAAEATTALGRHTIQESIVACKGAGIDVLYGDSVTGNTPVTVRSGGAVRIVPISMLYGPGFSGAQVWTDSGFADILHVYRHRVDKTIYRILTDTGCVECTEDHSLVIGGRAVRPGELKVGDRVEQFACGVRTPGKAGRAEYALGGIQARMLSADRAERLGHISAMFGDGESIEAAPESHFLLQSVAHMLGLSGMHYRLSLADGGAIRLTLADGAPPEPYVIRSIEARRESAYVYDLETSNHHFCGGIGNILLHNTDSLFLKKPTDEQIRTVIDSAKRDHGVELEVEKEYRYCVLSDRKKNYFGVRKSGEVDVKGLTGKKSHTPPFIKALFEEVIAVLSEVKDAEGFEAAKAAVSERIGEGCRRLSAGDIPVGELAFSMTMNKSVGEYTKSIPQHVRAAKMLESRYGRTLKRGDRIQYVKTKTQPGVKPVSMSNASEIDTAKYLEFMQSTLDQIASSMGLDFDVMAGKGKQSGLDEFFWG